MGTNGGTVDGRDGERERDLRLPRLFEELGLAKASGTYAKTLAKLASADVLVLDDLGIQKIREADRNDAASSTG
jgi:DNA replication protein DnaC